MKSEEYGIRPIWEIKQEIEVAKNNVALEKIKIYSVELMKIGKLDATINKVARSITSLGSSSFPLHCQ